MARRTLVLALAALALCAAAAPCPEHTTDHDGDPATECVACPAGTDAPAGWTGACLKCMHGCDDGNPCTTDSCTEAAGCAHEDVVCDDHDACTDDFCDSTGCVASPVSCDDGNACTQDSCSNSSGCANTAIVCDDHDACTVDSCDKAKGCRTAPLGCDDGNLCTVDGCSAGSCTHEQMSCDDGNACTVDTCSAGQCANQAISCDDGDACTVDTCSAGKCAHVTTCSRERCRTCLYSFSRPEVPAVAWNGTSTDVQLNAGNPIRMASGAELNPGQGCNGDTLEYVADDGQWTSAWRDDNGQLRSGINTFYATAHSALNARTLQTWQRPLVALLRGRLVRLWITCNNGLRSCLNFRVAPAPEELFCAV